MKDTEVILETGGSKSSIMDQCILTRTEIAKFAFTPVAFCNIECSFSEYKSIFRDDWCKFLFENLKKYVIVKCNWKIYPCCL